MTGSLPPPLATRLTLEQLARRWRLDADLAKAACNNHRIHLYRTARGGCYVLSADVVATEARFKS